MERERCPVSLQLLHPNSPAFSPPLMSFLTVSCSLISCVAPACSLPVSVLYRSPCVISSTPWSAPVQLALFKCQTDIFYCPLGISTWSPLRKFIFNRVKAHFNISSPNLWVVAWKKKKNPNILLLCYFMLVNNSILLSSLFYRQRRWIIELKIKVALGRKSI